MAWTRVSSASAIERRARRDRINDWPHLACLGRREERGRLTLYALRDHHPFRLPKGAAQPRRGSPAGKIDPQVPLGGMAHCHE
jgi:hypothetical protein